MPRHLFQQKKGNQTHWNSKSVCKGQHVKQLVATIREADPSQSIHINTGTHGDSNGNTIHTLPTTTSLAEIKFFLEDLQSIKDDANASIHNVTSDSPAYFPAKANHVINAWCFAATSDNQIVLTLDKLVLTIPFHYQDIAAAYRTKGYDLQKFIKCGSVIKTIEVSTIPKEDQLPLIRQSVILSSFPDSVKQEVEQKLYPILYGREFSMDYCSFEQNPSTFFNTPEQSVMLKIRSRRTHGDEIICAVAYAEVTQEQRVTVPQLLISMLAFATDSPAKYGPAYARAFLDACCAEELRTKDSSLIEVVIDGASKYKDVKKPCSIL